MFLTKQIRIVLHRIDISLYNSPSKSSISDPAKRKRPKKPSTKYFPPFLCKYCSKSFQTHGIRHCHEKIHTSTKPFSCDYCGRRFHRKDTLELHIRTHTKEKPFQCRYCDVSFSQIPSRSKHERSHVDSKLYACEWCDKRFNHPDNLINHNRVHTKEKPFVCEICLATFAQSCTLKVHKRVHTGETPYKCRFGDGNCANLVFSTLAGRNSHEYTHHRPNDKKYVCSVCLATFRGKHELRYHQANPRSNGLCSDTSKTCESCNKTFRTKRIYARHLKSLAHTGEKPYICKICNYGFLCPSYLKKHEMVHEKRYRVKCEVCQRSFIGAHTLKKHKLKFHNS